MVAVVVSTALRAWLVRGRTRGATAVITAANATAVIGVAAALWSWGRVRWDQVALRSVTTGNSFKGLWRPAVSNDLLFLVVGGREVGQHAYLVSVLVHVVAPLVAALA